MQSLIEELWTSATMPEECHTAIIFPVHEKDT
jgi:hypothetical protein